MATEPVPISDWLLERYALDELPADKAAEIARRVESDPALAARLQALKDSDREVLAQYPAPQMAERIGRRAASPRRPAWQRPALFAAPALAVAAALILVVRAPGDLAPTDLAPAVATGEPQIDRVKGLTPHLLAFRMHEGQSERVDEAQPLSAGEVVQLHYVAAGRAFGAIVSIDGGGAVTLHWPERPSRPAQLEPKGQISLPHAFELDAAPGFERFFLVTAPEPISAALVVEAARTLAAAPGAHTEPLHLPATWEQSSLCLRKDTP